MNAVTKNIAAKTADVTHLKAVEFELALDMQDIALHGFAQCLENAATSSGFTLLFNLPIPNDHPIQRLAGLATVDDGQPVFVLVGLNKSGSDAIIQPDLSDLPHMTAFAETYFDLVVD